MTTPKSWWFLTLTPRVDRMDIHTDTVDGSEILFQLIGRLSHCLQGFVHPRPCRSSSINSIYSIYTYVYMLHTFMSLRQTANWANLIYPASSKGFCTERTSGPKAACSPIFWSAQLRYAWIVVKRFEIFCSTKIPRSRLKSGKSSQITEYSLSQVLDFVHSVVPFLSIAASVPKSPKTTVFDTIFVHPNFGTFLHPN